MPEAQNVIFTGPNETGLNAAAVAAGGTPGQEGGYNVVLDAPGGGDISLYTVADRTGFDAVQENMTGGKTGFVLFLDNTRQDPLEDLEHYYSSFKDLVEDRGIVVAVIRTEEKPRPGLYSYHTKLAQLGAKLPVFEVDTSSHDDVKTTLLALVAVLNPESRR